VSVQWGASAEDRTRAAATATLSEGLTATDERMTNEGAA
jgi:hypothetical protein